MNLFDIIGPVMVGPSSSHTAGAVKIGQVTRNLLNETPIYAKIILHGSFAATGLGHGTHQAIIAGLLNMNPDDTRIPESETLAEQQDLKFDFEYRDIKGAHPNTAIIEVTGKNVQLEVQGSSIGGGRIIINKIDGLEVNFSGDYNTLIVHNHDQPGHVAEITMHLSKYDINIAAMQLYRDRRGGYAVMVIETDQPIENAVINEIKLSKDIIKVTYISEIK